MKKRITILIVIIAIVGFLFPVSNLIIKPKVSTALTDAKKNDPLFTGAAGVLQAKCMSCHAAKVALPFYASFPIASSMIQKDIDEGLAYYNFTERLIPPAGKAVDEVSLAKLEHTVARGTMPPGRFILLHWDGELGKTEKDDVLKWVHAVRAKQYATAGFPPEVGRQMLQPVPTTIALNETKVALGDTLYHDKRLSGDDTISCATCHELGKGGTDQIQFSRGIRDQFGGINAPTTYNSGYQFIQFWDGRAADLAEQAAGPVSNPIEMGAEWPTVVEKLKEDADLVTAMTEVYPDGVTQANVTDAIAEFEKTLITPNSTFDRFLAGDAKAMTSQEQEGYELFKAHACATCHVGKLVGGQSFEKMGLKQDYFDQRPGEMTEADAGRFNHTKDEKDRYTFKVPTLRNIAVTWPYFHDGSTKDLKEAVKTMSRVQWDNEFSDREADLVVMFLNTLTGEYKGELLK